MFTALLFLVLTPALASELMAPEEVKAECDKGEAWYCALYGGGVISGEFPDPTPRETALALLEPLCEEGWTTACFNLAAAAEVGDIVAADANVALKYYQKLCQLKERDTLPKPQNNPKMVIRDGCAMAAAYYLYDSKPYSAIELNADKGIAAGKAGCAYSDPYACYAVGYAYFEPIQVERSYEEAASYFAKACRYSSEKYFCKMEAKAKKKAEKAQK